MCVLILITTEKIWIYILADIGMFTKSILLINNTQLPSGNTKIEKAPNSISFGYILVWEMMKKENKS